MTTFALQVFASGADDFHRERLNTIVNGPFLAIFFPKVTLLMGSNLKFLEACRTRLANLKPSEGFGCYRSDDACPTAS